MAEACTDAELIARAGNRPELFGLLFDCHFATIHRYIERRIGAEGADNSEPRPSVSRSSDAAGSARCTRAHCRGWGGRCPFL
jgi:hypothetical protein